MPEKPKSTTKLLVEFQGVSIFQSEADVLKKIGELFNPGYGNIGGVKIPRIKKYDSRCRLGFIVKKNHVAELYIYNWDTRFKALPASIGKLAFLEILSIQNTCFKKLPDSIGDQYSLQELNLSGNMIQIPGTFSHLESLKKLSLGSCYFETVPEPVCKLKNLEALSMHSCTMKKIPTQIGKLVSLQYLNIDSNYLSTLPNP